MRIIFLLLLCIYIVPAFAQRNFSEKTNRIGITMVYLPAGTFLMGSSEKEIEDVIKECKAFSDHCLPQHYANELPKRAVTIKNGFWIGKYEVTQKEWKKVMGTSPSYFTCEDCPVENVTWNDIQEFIKKLNALQDGFFYSLPTEAQWEYAARAGTKTVSGFGTSFITSDDANFDGNFQYGTRAIGVNLEKTTPVGTYLPNLWGLYDMHGNVLEVCQDVYNEKGYMLPIDGTANKNGLQDWHVIRGGCWASTGLRMRSAYREQTYEKNKSEYIGFRIVASDAGSAGSGGRNIEPFSSNGFASFQENGKWGIIDKNSRVIVKPLFEKAFEKNGSFVVRTKTAAGIYDFQGKEIIKPDKYWEITVKHPGVYAVYDNVSKKMSVYNASGDKLLPYDVYEFKVIKEGLIQVMTPTRQFYIDFQGNSVDANGKKIAAEPIENADIKRWEAHIKQNPKDPDGYLQRGIVYYNTGNFPLALADFSKSIEINPEYMTGNASYWRAEIYFKQGKFELSLADINQIIKLETTYSRALPDLIAFRARIYCKLGLKVAAAEDEKKVVELGGEIAAPCK